MTISFPVGTISRNPVGGSISDPTYGSISTNFAEQLILEALVNLDPTGIVGSPNPTEWTNSGTGGSAYDLDVVVGTGANLTLGSQNGHTTIVSAGSAGLESTAGQTINAPLTVFLVGRSTETPLTAQRVFFDARSSAAARCVLFANNAGNVFTLLEGGSNLAGPAYDTNPHVFTGQYNADASSKITVSGLGSATGDAGNHNWHYCTIFAALDGSTALIGFIAQLLVFDRALNPTEIAAIQSFLAIKFAL